MEKKYNQFAAMVALTKAALKAIFRSPSAVVFSLVFPFIFILVFGFKTRLTAYANSQYVSGEPRHEKSHHNFDDFRSDKLRT